MITLKLELYFEFIFFLNLYLNISIISLNKLKILAYNNQFDKLVIKIN